MKHKYTSIADTPILVRAKKAYLNASDVSMICWGKRSSLTFHGRCFTPV